MTPIDFSLSASVAKYEEYWYKQKHGIPTGGSLCVQLANITVFYVMVKEVYSVPGMMTNIGNAKRFIDDGSGFFLRNGQQFDEWLAEVNRRISPHGLYIN